MLFGKFEKVRSSVFLLLVYEALPFSGDVKVVITHFLDQSSTFKADVTVSNLLPSRTYFFSFVATTKSGLKSPPTREVRVDLLPSVPNVSWNRLDNGILRLNWNNTDHADETSYTIGVAKVSSMIVMKR